MGRATGNLTVVPEQWRPVVVDPDGYGEGYEVSDHGQARSLARQVAGRDGSIRVVQGKILSPRIRVDGTRAVNLWRGNSYRQKPIKRLVLEAFHGPPPSASHDAKNIDEDPANNALANLRWEAGGLALLRRRLGN